jgi:hypothetical protein
MDNPREELLRRAGASKREAFKLDDKDATAQALRETRQQFRSELERFAQAGSLLQESSNTIGYVFNEYLNYRGSLKKASQALSELKRRMETDDSYIWYSFLFFIAVVSFILSKRLGVLTIISWLVNWLFYIHSCITCFIPISNPLNASLANITIALNGTTPPSLEEL